MKMPAPIWPMTYSASRRKHNHRCRSCQKIIQEGEAVLMARVANGRTRCVHDTAECADMVVINGYTQRQLMEAHGMQHLAKVGFSEAQNFIDNAPICRAPA